MKWSADVLEFVERAWCDGRTGAEIAQEMSGLVGERITRNVVIGIVHRGGYGRSPTGPVVERRHAPTAPRPVVQAEPPEPSKKIGRRKVTPPPPIIAKIYTGPKPLEEREPDECAWPFGHSPVVVFCCKPREEWKGRVTAYCSEHNALMWRHSTAAVAA